MLRNWNPTEKDPRERGTRQKDSREDPRETGPHISGPTSGDTQGLRQAPGRNSSFMRIATKSILWIKHQRGRAQGKTCPAPSLL